MKATPKTTISRERHKGHYDAPTIYSIIDEALYGVVSYAVNQEPFAIPTGHVRLDNKIYIHGSVGSHFLRTLTPGLPVCLTFTLMDGLVLARSAFDSSVNYRSVVVFSQATLEPAKQTKLQVLQAFTNKLMPGRWQDLRPPTEKELAKTSIMSFEIQEASAKIRQGPPIDGEEGHQVWHGHIPLKSVYGAPVPHPEYPQPEQVPPYISQYIAGYNH